MASSSATNNDEVATLYSLIDQGLVTPVKNQHDSKSCRVHAQLACLEAEYKKNGAKKELYDLSVQAVIDGDPGPANGDFSKGYSMERYTAFIPFLTTTENYKPNKNLERGDFRKDQIKPPIPIVRPHYDLDILTGPDRAGIEKVYMAELDKCNVICAGINGSSKEFADYKEPQGKLFRGPDAEPREQLDHSVAIVGYGKTKGGEQFWQCKNSYGENWGEKGYIHVAFGGGPFGYGGILREGEVYKLDPDEEMWEKSLEMIYKKK